MSTADPALRTVRDWIRHASTRMARVDLHYGHGTDEPWDEAVALVRDLLRIPPDRLAEMLAAALTATEREALADALERRIDERVPVPYLTGRAWLAGLPFAVDERVIVPRSPVAGLLADGLQPWLGERTPRRILDLCAGSGCLGIVAALAFADAELVLADVSADALAVAWRNVGLHGLADRTVLRSGDGLAAVADEAPFDLVLFNPPYVDAAELATMPPEFGHEPRLALDGGDDGLDLVARVLGELPALLTDDGLLVLEVGNSAPALLERFGALPWLWPDLDDAAVGVALLDAAALARKE